MVVVGDECLRFFGDVYVVFFVKVGVGKVVIDFEVGELLVVGEKVEGMVNMFDEEGWLDVFFESVVFFELYVDFCVLCMFVVFESELYVFEEGGFVIDLEFDVVFFREIEVWVELC